MPAKGGLARSPPNATPQPSVSMSASVARAESPPKTSASSSQDVYNMATLPRETYSATPLGRKRFRANDLLSSDASAIDLLGLKVDDLTAAIAKSDESIRLLMAENHLMRNDLIVIKSLIQSVFATKTTPAAVPATKTYASAVKSKDVVIVQPKDANQTCEATRAAVVNAVNPVESGVCGVIDGSNGKIVIECQSLAASVKIRDAVDVALSSTHEVKAPSKRMPKIRVFGLRVDMSEPDFLDAIKKQNADIFNSSSHIRILKKFEVKKPNTKFGFKLEVDPATFKLVIAAQRVCVGWDKCWVNEEFNLLRCYNCWGYHHTQNTCKNDKTCFKCGESHESVNCKPEIEKCCVCISKSASSGLSLDTSHNAKSVLCPTYLHKIEMEKRNINYD